MYKRLLQALYTLALLSGLIAPLHAQEKLLIGHTPIAEVVSLYVGVEQGIFKRHGLDVQLIPNGVNSILPAALAGGSMQVAAPSPTVFLQAVAGGLELVTIGGCGVTSAATAKNIGLVVRKDVRVDKASDLIGKKVGVPGIGATLHVLLRQWLIDEKVDPAKVTFVEVAVPNSSDVLKGKSVDAVLTGEPMMGRIVTNDIGYVARYIVTELPAGLPFIVFATTKDWAAKNPGTVRNLRASFAEASDFVRANPAKAQEDIAKYTRLPIEVVRALNVPDCRAIVDSARMGWFANTMFNQKMLDKPIDVHATVAP